MSEIARAFEYDPGEYVFLDDEDFDAVKVDGFRTIDISDFVPYEQIDPIYFRAHVLRRPGQGCREGVRPPPRSDGEVRPRRRRNVRHARSAAPRLPSRPGPGDHARADVLRRRSAADGRARSGEGRCRPSRAHDGGAADRELHGRLRAVEVHRHLPRRAHRDHRGEAQGQGRPSRQARGAGARPRICSRRCARASTAPRDRALDAPHADGELEELSKDELYERAQRADIPGRSRMSRTKLIEALRA